MAAAKSELDPGRYRRRLSRHRGKLQKQRRTDDRSFQSPQIRRMGDWQSRIRLGARAVYEGAAKIRDASARREYSVRRKAARLIFPFASSVRKNSATHRYGHWGHVNRYYRNHN